MKPTAFSLFIAFIVLASSSVVNIYPPGSNLWTALTNTVPGTTLVVHGGKYSTQQTGGSWYRSVNIVGTLDKPILVVGGTNGTVVISSDPAGSQNNINIAGQNFLWEGCEIVYGSLGLRLMPNVSNAIFSNLYVHDTQGSAITANIDGAAYNNITFEKIEVTRTCASGIPATGECFYLGCNNGACSFTNSIVNNNWCHDTAAPCIQSGFGAGIQVKTGSYNNIVSNNVVYNVSGVGIFPYTGVNGNPENIVNGNVVWLTGDIGIQVTANAIIVNNIVLATTGDGIAIQSNQGNPTNVQVGYNTVYSKSCFYAAGSWSTGVNFTIDNNAFYCPTGRAIGIGNTNPNAKFSGNYILGSTAAGGTLGNGLSDFVNVATDNFFPSKTCAFINKGSNLYHTPYDFNGTPRNQDNPTPGAYEYKSTGNPGWAVHSGFKQTINSLVQIYPMEVKDK